MVKGRFGGTAFIEFETEDSATSGLSMTGSEVQGRFIVVGRSDPNIRKGKRIK